MKTNKKTLLEQVKEIPACNRGRPRTIEPNVDVAMAWLKEEIALHQISKTIWPDSKGTSTMAYLFLNHSILKAYQEGRIKIVE